MVTQVGKARGVGSPSTSEAPSTPVVGIARGPIRVTPRRSSPSLTALDRDERAVGVGTVLAPVEPRMSVEDLQAAEQQKREAEDVDPMRQAHRKGVPMDEDALGPLDGRREPG